jgi:type II secretory pathway component PulF
LSERGPAAARPPMRRIKLALDQGESLQTALNEEAASFPPLFLALASVGEETGQLPEIFGELEKYYLLQQKLRRQLLSQSMLPLIQICFAFFIIALLIFVLGMIGQSRNTKPPGVFGFTGASGSIAFLVLSFGTIGVLLAAYRIVTRTFRQKPVLDAMLLRVPALGPAVEALVLGRFALALRLTLETGMSIQRVMRLSLEATGNAAFAAQAPTINESLKAGDDLTIALSRCRLFPQDFLNMVAVAEEGGRIPEMMRHQADYYYEEAGRRLTVLTKLATFGIWLVYAGFMVIAIFSIANIYLSALGGR